MSNAKIEAGAKLLEALELKAAELRKREPNLTREQAFAKVYAAPENRKLAEAERWANGFRTADPEGVPSGSIS